MDKKLDIDSKVCTFNIENAFFSVLFYRPKALLPEIPSETINKSENEGPSITYHSHHYYEMFYPVTGEFKVSFTDETISVKPGEILCIAPNTIHDAHWTDDCEIYSVSFSFSSNRLKTKNNLLLAVTELFTAPYVHISHCESLGSVLIPMVKSFKSTIALSAYKIANQFYQIIEMLLNIKQIQRISPENEISDTDMQRLSVINRILDKYYKQNITHKDIAEILFLSPRQVDRIVSRYYGCTLHQRITHLKMKSASKQLLTTDKSISEISCDLGYNSPNTFYSAFKKYYGCLPGDYRSKKIE